MRVRLLLLAALAAVVKPAVADQVIMKDGTIYKGKITIDTDKALLIGNPPFDPTSYLLETKDIEKIIYEEYHPLPPAERRRGFVFDARLSGNAFSSSELKLNPAAGLYAGGGFRMHPLFEFEAGVDYLPAISAKNQGLTVTDGETTRRYQKFGAFNGTVGGRFYPFFKKKWRTEPYLATGYVWSRLTPKASGDKLSGSGWRIGVGAHHPLATHLFLDGRFEYQSITYDTIDFLGREGQISPEIGQRRFGLVVGLSYRL